MGFHILVRRNFYIESGPRSWHLRIQYIPQIIVNYLSFPCICTLNNKLRQRFCCWQVIKFTQITTAEITRDHGISRLIIKNVFKIINGLKLPWKRHVSICNQRYVCKWLSAGRYGYIYRNKFLSRIFAGLAFGVFRAVGLILLGSETMWNLFLSKKYSEMSSE